MVDDPHFSISLRLLRLIVMSILALACLSHHLWQLSINPLSPLGLAVDTAPFHERRVAWCNRLARTTFVAVQPEHSTSMAYICMRCFLTSLFDCCTLCARTTSRLGSDRDGNGRHWLGSAPTFMCMHSLPNSGYSNPSCAHVRNGRNNEMESSYWRKMWRML